MLMELFQLLLLGVAVTPHVLILHIKAILSDAVPWAIYMFALIPLLVFYNGPSILERNIIIIITRKGSPDVVG